MDDRLTVVWRCCSRLPSTFFLQQKTKFTLFSDYGETRFESGNYHHESTIQYVYISSCFGQWKWAYHHNRQLFILRAPIPRHDHIDCQTLTCNMLVNALSKDSVVHRSHHTKNIRLREKKHHSQSSLSRDTRITCFKVSIASLGTWGGKAGIRRVCCAHAGPNVVARWCPV